MTFALERTFRDRPWQTALILALTAALFRAIATLLVPLPYAQDEAMWIQAASSVWREGVPRVSAGRLPLLYPLLLAPMFGSLEFSRAYDLSKVLNSALSAATLFPVWRVARRFVSETAALVIAFASVLGVPGTFASAIMAESLFFLLFWTMLAVFSSAVENSNPSGAVRLCVAIVLILAAKPQSLPAVALVSLAYFLAPRSRRMSVEPGQEQSVRLLFAGLLTVGLLLLGAINAGTLFGSYYAAESRHFRAQIGPIAHEFTGLLALVALEIGLLPMAAIALNPRLTLTFGPDPSRRFLRLTFLCVAVIYLLAASVYGSTVTRDRLHERHTFFVSPVFLILGAVGLRHSTKRRWTSVLFCALLLILLVMSGLRQFPSHYVLDIISAPTRAALVQLPDFQEEPPTHDLGAVSIGAACLAGLVVAVGLSLRRFRSRLLFATLNAAGLGLLVCISQVRWSESWARQRYTRPVAESVVIPAGAKTYSLHDEREGVADIALFELARHPVGLHHLLLRDLSILGSSGVLAGGPAPASSEQYWVVPQTVLLRADQMYQADQIRIYRSLGAPRAKAIWTRVELVDEHPQLRLQYFPADPFLDETLLKVGLRTLPGANSIVLEARSETQRVRWDVPPKGIEKSIRLKRQGHGAIALILENIAETAAGTASPGFVIDHVSAFGAAGEILDELRP